MQDNSQKSQYDLAHLYASIAHEVNNPLTIIDGYAEILCTLISRPEIDRDAISKYCGKLQTTIRRVSRIVNGLKEMATSSEGSPSESVDLAMIISDAINLCEDKISRSNAEIHTIQDLALPMQGWPWQLIQIFCNLIMNAIDAVQDQSKGIIKISLVSNEDKYVIAVEDNGSGVPIHIRDRIFFPFYTTKFEGTGMGLALTRQFLENHQGTIQLDGSVNFGRFLVTLPKHTVNVKAAAPMGDPTDFLSPRNPAPVGMTSANVSAPPIGHPVEKIQGSILVVDDEQEIADIIKFHLALSFTTVLSTTSAKEALRILAQRKIDVLVTDIVMPELTGFELVEAAKSAGFKGSVVIVSGSSTQMPEEALLTGVDSVFNKPISYSSLISRLRFLLKPVEVINSKRQFERMVIHSKLKVRIAFQDKELAGNVGDIGRGGFFFSGEPHGMNLGDEVAIRIFYRNVNLNRVFDAVAAIRWITDSGAGLQFTHIDDSNMPALSELINFVKTSAVS